MNSETTTFPNFILVECSISTDKKWHEEDDIWDNDVIS